MSSKNVLLKNVVKIYKGQGKKDVVAVNNVSLEIKAGEFVTLLGPSGCGKTTLLRIIAGFETPTGGEVYIGGENVTPITPDRRDTAMVFQSYALFPHLTVYENVAYGLRVKKQSESRIRQSVTEMLELVGLTGMESRYPNQLSGGQQQRVALARSIVMRPSVLLFDEPLSNLDAKLRVHMRGEIRRLQRQVGITGIYVTHDQAEAMSMSDRIIVMNNGVVEQSGTPQEIYITPASAFVADFIGMANLVDAVVAEAGEGQGIIDLLGAKFRISSRGDLRSGEKVRVVIRPEAVALAGDGGIPAVVETSVYMGSSQDYRVRIDGQTISVVAYNPDESFREGDRVYLRIDERKLHVVRK